MVEWVPRKENSLAGEMSKLIIPDDWRLQRALFQQLEQRWGRHFADLFASNANNQHAFFYSLHWSVFKYSVSYILSLFLFSWNYRHYDLVFIG